MLTREQIKEKVRNVYLKFEKQERQFIEYDKETYYKMLLKEVKQKILNVIYEESANFCKVLSEQELKEYEKKYKVERFDMLEELITDLNMDELFSSLVFGLSKQNENAIVYWLLSDEGE